MPRINKKALIYEQAAQLFKEKGYQAASMRELATRVALKVSSLYSHIGSKEEILQKFCFDNAQAFIDGMDKIKLDLSLNNIQKIEALIRLHVHIATQNPMSATVFNDEWRNLSAPYLKDFLAMRKQYELDFKAIIEAGIASGELKSLNADVALFTILTSVRWLHYWYGPQRNINTEALCDQIILLLVTGAKAS